MKLYFALVAFIFAGCTGGGAQTEELPIPYPTREEVISLMYDPLYSVPDNFYTDRPNVPRGYSLYHVKNAGNYFELCTNDENEALTWEDADNASRVIKGVFVEWSENDRYFQITRELDISGSTGNTGLSEPGFARVFKCNYVNRDGVDRDNPNGYGGQFNATVNAQSVQNFVQYMWQWTFWWPTEAKVLRSYGTNDSHTLLLSLRTRQTSGCDLIQVLDWQWTFDSTGQVERALYHVDRFEVCGT